MLWKTDLTELKVLDGMVFTNQLSVFRTPLDMMEANRQIDK